MKNRKDERAVGGQGEDDSTEVGAGSGRTFAARSRYERIDEAEEAGGLERKVQRSSSAAAKFCVDDFLLPFDVFKQVALSGRTLRMARSSLP
jgi:hypothetical protein